MADSSSADLTGKVAVVTGATSGIGKEIARGLARLGATVVIPARSPDKAARTQEELAKDAKGGIEVMALDVASIASMRAFAAELAKKHPHVNILVNNAGAWFTDRRTSPDGIELTFATDVIGPYLLSQLLLPLLQAGAPSRIINIVSSFAANYDASDLQFQTRKFDGFKAYGAAKQALRMITWGQAARFHASGVTVNAAAPGFVKTDFNQNARGFIASMINFSARFFGVTPAKGAETPIWVASDPALAAANGKYFDGHKEKDGKFHDAAAIADLERRLDELIAAAATRQSAA